MAEKVSRRKDSGKADKSATARKSSGKAGNQTPRQTMRAKRFATVRELRAAVREECLAEVRKCAGPVAWADGIESYVASTRAMDDRPRHVWRALVQALLDANDLALTPPASGPYLNPYDALVRRFVVEHPLAITQGVFWRRMLAADSEMKGPEAWHGRALLVRRLDHPGLLWWNDRLPTHREIAILSLLDGDLPDGIRQRQNAAKHSGNRLSYPTVAEVIAAETNAVREVRARLSKKGE